MARTSSRSDKTYRSKIDIWVLAIFAVCLGAMAIGLVAALAIGDMMHLVQRFFVTLGLAGFLIWFLIGTHYTLTGRDLVVRAGPMRWTIAIDQITSIAPESGFLSMRSSPSLSLDRLAVRYGANKRVLISPEDKTAFLKEIASRGASI